MVLTDLTQKIGSSNFAKLKPYLLFIALMSLKLLTIGLSIRIPLPTLFIADLGVIGFIMGIVSFVKNKDRSLLTLLSIPIGLLIILWVAAEIAFPH